MRILLTLILTLASTCFLQAEFPSWKSGKRAYRESHCNYKEKCTADFCSQNKILSCECESSPEESIFSELTKLIMAGYDVFVDEEAICEFNEKCYQYGYCLGCECDLTKEDLQKVVETLLEKDKDSPDL